MKHCLMSDSVALGERYSLYFSKKFGRNLEVAGLLPWELIVSEMSVFGGRLVDGSLQVKISEKKKISNESRFF